MLKHVGAYFLMIRLMFIKPTKRSIMYGLVLKEIQDLILGSLGIVCFLSFCGRSCLHSNSFEYRQHFYPRKSGWFCNAQSIILEFAPTFMAIILAGKVGSYITSSIGTMRVTEQIDALEVMGINSVNFLVFQTLAMTLLPMSLSFLCF